MGEDVYLVDHQSAGALWKVARELYFVELRVVYISLKMGQIFSLVHLSKAAKLVSGGRRGMRSRS